MEIFNYVMVLASVVIGLALTHLLQGAARIVQHPRRYNAYWVHLIWGAYIFEYAALWWWYEFGFAGRAHWTFALYGFILLYSVTIYFTCAILFPADLEGYDGFEDYLISRRVWFFAFNIEIILLDVADTGLKGVGRYQQLGWHYIGGAIIFPLLYGVAIIKPGRRYIAALALLSLADHTWQSFQNFNVMR